MGPTGTSGANAADGQASSSSSNSNSRGPIAALTVAVAILAVACGGIYNTSSHNAIFPIVVDLVQIVREGLFGAPTDESVFQYGDDGLPLCMGCHCTPRWDEDPSTFVCPTGELPPWNYSTSIIEALEGQHARNPFSLDCDPYYDDECDTVPSLGKGSWGADAVCGLVYDEPLYSDAATPPSSRREGGERAPCPLSNYTMRTYRTELDATDGRAVVTHTGPCGACSTTRDLAAYMRHPDMVSAGRRCTNRVMLSHDWGVRCYEDLGFTKPCATIWAHNSLHTATVCRTTCVRHLFSPPNEPEPHCRLNECLHCDEVRSGPNFQLFAGRTRRNSGLRTPILRQCEGLATMVHDGCPLDIVMAAADAAAAADASSE